MGGKNVLEENSGRGANAVPGIPAVEILGTYAVYEMEKGTVDFWVREMTSLFLSVLSTRDDIGLDSLIDIDIMVVRWVLLFGDMGLSLGRTILVSSTLIDNNRRIYLQTHHVHCYRSVIAVAVHVVHRLHPCQTVNQRPGNKVLMVFTGQCVYTRKVHRKYHARRASLQ